MRIKNSERGQTVVGQINPAILRLLRSFVCEAIHYLQWRHSGLGMLQGYVLEGGQEEVRVHIWHPSLKIDDIDGAGLGHDHRFDMTSWVLAGRLTHVEIEASSDLEGKWKMYEVVNARKALHETGTRAGEFRLIEGVVRLAKNAISISAGNNYFFPKRSFHETHPDSPVVITIARKTNQNEVPARILCKLEREPVNAFGTSVSETQCKLVLAEAEAVLRDILRLDSFAVPTESAPKQAPQWLCMLRRPNVQSDLRDLSELRDPFWDRGLAPAVHKE